MTLTLTMTVEMTGRSLQPQDIERWLVEHLVASLGIEAAVLGRDTRLADLGIDSAEAALLAGALEEWLQTRLSPTLVWEHPTLGQLASYLARQVALAPEVLCAGAGAEETPPPALEAERPARHPFIEHVNPHLGELLERLRLDKCFVRGRGCELFDATGRRYLDFIASYGAVPFGHNPPEIWEALGRMREDEEPSLVQPSFLQAAGALAHRLVALAPQGLRYVTLTNSGAEAVEAAIKLCRAATDRPGILAAQGSFHGKTLGALSATGNRKYQAHFGAPVPGFEHVPFGDAGALAAALAARPGHYAAFVVEPIQGEGGIVEPPPGYLARARALCQAAGTLLVLDEVQTGLGRTGAMFACQAEGVVPDVMTLAKALGGGLVPIGACLASEAAYSETFALKHSSTFAGGGLACRVSLAVLDLLECDGGSLVRAVAENGARFKTALAALGERHPRVVAEVRGRGYLLGLRLGVDRSTWPSSLLGVAAEQGGLAPLLASYLERVGKSRSPLDEKVLVGGSTKRPGCLILLPWFRGRPGRMSSSSTGGNRQRELFPISTTPTISVDPNHRLVQLTHELDWTTIEEKVQQIRRQKLKSRAGRKPHLRALTGAVVLMSVRKVGYREAEDLIRNYAPARYLCGLTESSWSPDFTTIQDFTQLLGPEGMELLNQHTVKQAVEEKLADPKVIVADTTAQEAPIGHPNEMGLMSAFLTAAVAASRKLTGIAPGLYQKMLGAWKRGKKKLRSYRLFAKTKEAKNELIAQMAGLVDRAQRQLTRAMEAAAEKKDRLVKSGKTAWSKLERLGQTMARLLPQIRSWLKTGKVATAKIISVHMPELYAIVRGKVGKAVEFGLRWGLTRLRGGFLLAKVAMNRLDLQDSKYAVQAVDDHMALFGKAPRAYAYDRGGYSKSNIQEIKKKGVKQVALAPRGKARWSVGGRVKKRLIKERALIEGGIGALKSGRYGFHRPAARSAEMMATCGQRAVLGLNLNKLVRGLAHRKKVRLVG